ncbi:MAG: EAL domain-containing protein [Acidobacteria bacterium]|nr:EAL domain-containing protein [Acidobacteriota bacterium]
MENSLTTSAEGPSGTALPYRVKIAVSALGLIALAGALAAAPFTPIGVGYVFVLAFAVFVAPRMTLQLSGSNLTLSFSDAVVFFTFIVYGGELAVITAFVETFANCVYLKRRRKESPKFFVLFNASLSALIVAATYGVVELFSRAVYGSAFIDLRLTDTRTLAAVLGLIALTHFFFSSAFAAFYQKLRTHGSFLEIWKTHCVSSALTHFTGAGVAGATYKVFNYGDVALGVISFVVVAVAYINYRTLINDINRSIASVEEAERQKADAERQRAEVEKTRRKEAESYAEELCRSLEKEARANDALRKSERELQHAASHDSLTGLSNRKHLGDVLRELIAAYKQDSAATFQVLFLDIRSFKNINDTLGHSIGDKVLSVAAKRFSRVVNAEDTVARIGGDEFAIVLRGLATAGKAQKVARKIHRNITQPFSLAGNRVSIDVNIGIAPCDTEYDSPEEILRDADIAMHYAKERKDGPAVFTKELRHRFLERVRFEMDLRHAVERNELSMHYQPIVSLIDGRLAGFEALLRWHHPEFGMIPPNKFIPIAESSDLIQPITYWILRETTKQLAAWQAISPDYGDLEMSVNIAGRHLSSDDLSDQVEDALENSGIRPETLKLEITESTAMENAERSILLLNRLKSLGVKLSIDDFGTGYSSLSYLHRLPFDTLKIDRSFVSGAGERGENSGILQTIVSLGTNLKMRMVAEGIETETQLATLRNLGCDFGQGYLFSKPKPAEEMEKLLYARHSWLPSQKDAAIELHSDSDTQPHIPLF